MSEPRDDVLLRVRGLAKEFGRRDGLGRRSTAVTALHGVDLDVRRGRTFGIVGESGCGKSTLARCLLRLIEPTRGTVHLAGDDILAMDDARLRAARRRMQMVFQDASGALDPRMTVGDLVAEPLLVHAIGDARTRRDRATAALTRVGLGADAVSRRPHEFSGGQRQRIGIARALVLEPELVVLDEPVSALDVSVQAQVLNLLDDLQDEYALTYLFIVHDLAVAEYFCDEIAVLYLGRVVESGTREALFTAPQHPYTAGLLAAAPIPDPARRHRATALLRGDAATAPTPDGCPFRDRCPVGAGRSRCADERPALRDLGGGQHAACHYPGELASG